MTRRPGPAPLSPASSDVAAMLTQLGGVVLSLETVQTTVDLVTRLAATTISGTAGAGVSLVDARSHRTTAASDPLVAEADALQYVLGSGPCLSAWSEGNSIRIDDLATEVRWPAWTAAAGDLGVQSMMSVPLVTAGTSVGAMKVYSRHRQTYDDRAEEVLTLFAQQASVLLANMMTLSDARRLSSQLSDALHRRDVVGQAKGVLLARGAADEQSAFAMLVAASSRTGVKLHQVAAQLLASLTDRRSGSRSPD